MRLRRRYRTFAPSDFLTFALRARASHSTTKTLFNAPKPDPRKREAKRVLRTHDRWKEFSQVRVHSGPPAHAPAAPLAIVKKAVERMGGSVGVASALGHGSQFWTDLVAVPDHSSMADRGGLTPRSAVISPAVEIGAV